MNKGTASMVDTDKDREDNSNRMVAAETALFQQPHLGNLLIIRLQIHHRTLQILRMEDDQTQGVYIAVD